MPLSAATNHTARPKKRTRDLHTAATLRPREVFELYGIPSSTLCELCKHPDQAKRLPSLLVPGRQGRKGIRLIPHAELRAWLERWRQSDTRAPEFSAEGRAKPTV